MDVSEALSFSPTPPAVDGSNNCGVCPSEPIEFITISENIEEIEDEGMVTENLNRNERIKRKSSIMAEKRINENMQCKVKTNRITKPAVKELPTEPTAENEPTTENDFFGVLNQSRDKIMKQITEEKKLIDENRNKIKPKGFIPHYSPRILIELTNKIVNGKKVNTKAVISNTIKESKTDTKMNGIASDGNKLTAADKFFYDDLEFLKKKKTKKNKKSKKGSKKEFKEYLKLKERNTRINRGYNTVIPRHKAIIGLDILPKTFYRKRKRNTQVFFDFDSLISVHNNMTNIKPILINDESERHFEWDKEKETVDIVRRVDLEPETSIEEFVFKRVRNSVEL